MTVRRGSLCTREVEFRAAADDNEPGDGRTLDGYAAVFDQDTEINSWEGRFIETMKKGAFRKTLRENKGRIQMQYDHGRDIRVGTVPIGYYERLEEDDHGLHVVGRLFDNDVVEPVRQAIEAKAIQGMSFRFRVIRDEWRDAKGKLVKPEELLDLLWSNDPERGPLRRTIKEVALDEAGPVSRPAYAGTSVGVRSDEEPELSREELIAAYRSTMLVEETRSADEPPAPAEEPADDPEPEARESEPEPEFAGLDDAARRSTLSRLAFRYDAARTGTSDRSPQKEATRKVESPMTLDELKARAAELRAQLVSIDEEARGVALDETKQAEWDKAEAELRSTEESIKSIEARQARIAEFASERSERVERTQPGAPAFHAKKDPFDIEAIRSDARSPEDFVARAKENAHRAIDEMRYSRVTSKEKAQERISELLEDYDDESGTLAKRILVTGSPLYERAFSKAMKACTTAVLTGEEARVMALSTNSGADGGYAVPVQLDPTVILTNDGFVGDLRSVSRVETIVGKKWQGVTSTGITVQRDSGLSGGSRDAGVGRVSELEEASDNSFTLAQPELEAVRVQGFVPFSIEIDQDWGSLRSEISRMLADAKSREELESFTLGNGTGTPKEPVGVVGGLSGNSLVSPLTAETFSSEDVYNLELAIAPRWRRNAKFMANRATYTAIRQFADADGHDLWERIGNGQPARLLGYDALENSYMDDTAMEIDDGATATHKILLLADFQQFLIVDRVGMDVEFVPHVFGANGRPTGQRGVYAIWRNNAAVLVPDAFKLLTVTTSA